MSSTRRLAAIMFTDTVGFTASAQANEGRALDLLRQQAELVRPLVAVHQGREIKSTGDGFLVEFDSALKATQCAVAIQRRIYERNAEGGLSPIQIRIGIHLGDVVQRGTDILGDAVNIAARIEPIADPGGICVSGAVHEQIRNKIPDKLEKLPPAALKGLEVPMEVYRVTLPWAGQPPHSARDDATGLAVLPFTNMSIDPSDLYFADGLTEELITVLSQLKQLRVIARTSVMPFKSTSKGVAQIGAELRVSSILEGSVRKAGNRLRVTAQLIDVETEGHLWAKSYDRELDDVFVVQTDIAKQVAEALKIELLPADQVRLGGRPLVRADSYLAYLKGRTLFHSFSKVSRDAAREQFERAIALDPQNAPAYSGLADVTSGAEQYARRRELAEKALQIDPNIAEAHASLALVLMETNQYREAEKEYRLALGLNPSYSPAHHWYAELLADQARTDEALDQWALAEAADPLAPFHLEHYAQLLIWLGKLDAALVLLERLHELEPDNKDYFYYRANYLLARSDLTGCLEALKISEESVTEPRLKPLLRAVGLSLAGQKEQARALLRQEETLPDLPGIIWAYIWAYCELGDLDDCFRWVERGLSRDYVSFRWLRLSPRLAPIRSDPRFEAVLKRMPRV